MTDSFHSSSFAMQDLDGLGDFADPFSFPMELGDAAYQPVTAPPPPITTTGPRAYKSRRYRPCDFCRARKSACKIDAAPPCHLCYTYGRECTFVEQPSKRKRADSSGAVRSHVREDNTYGATDTDNLDLHVSSISPQSALSTSHSPPGDLKQRPIYSSAELLAQPSNKKRRHHGPDQHNSSSTIEKQVHVSSGNGTTQRNLLRSAATEPSEQRWSSLGSKPNNSAVFVGDTGEADPYLLRRYHYDEDDETILSGIIYRRMRNTQSTLSGLEMGKDSFPAVFMLPEDGLADNHEPRHDNGEIDEAYREIAAIFKSNLGVRMLKLFFRFVYPYFPILSREQMLSPESGIRAEIDALPLSLLAAIYATALPFLPYDHVLATSILHSPPSSSQLYRTAWLGITQEIHAPRLATIQACLLLLQRHSNNRYVMHTPFQWSMMAWTSSLAQTIGLSQDSSTWTSLPPWERRLRGRLWWAVYIMDKWSFLGAGMPSHIKSEDFDMPPPILSSESGCDHRPSSPSSDAPDCLSVGHHFYHLVQLTIILSDIVDAFYTVRATSLTADNFPLSLELAKPLHSRLKAWKDCYSLSISPTSSRSGRDIELDGNPALGFAYIVATMTLFRALLRPLDKGNFGDGMDGDDENRLYMERKTVLIDATECSKEAIEFIEGLNHGVWDAFWHGCKYLLRFDGPFAIPLLRTKLGSRANFAMASSFLMRVYVNITSAAEKEEFKELVMRWRRALRPGSGNAGNGMMGLALLRLEGSLREGILDIGEHPV